MKTLREQYSAELDLGSTIEKENLLDRLLQVYENENYVELSIITGALKALYNLYQSYHWQSSGEHYYGDHLLFQRFYEDLLPQIDNVGERAVGLSQNASIVDATKINNVASIFMSQIEKGEGFIGEPSDILFKKSKKAEECFKYILETSMTTLEQKGLLTGGVSNLIEDIMDQHETSCYLIGQRIKSHH